MRNIVLTGFMGTGKTAVARLLAKKLKLKYVSTDGLIEEKEKIPIARIFAEKGEGYFRKIEKEVIEDVSAMENAVIDAGGGAIIDPENVRNLKKKGKVFCLWAEPEVILARTKKYSTRPLLNVKDPLGAIKKLLAERKPFYERGDFHVHTKDLSAEKVAAAIERIMSRAG